MKLFKHLAGHRNKVTKNHYPNDDSEIVVVMTCPAQAKLAYLVMAGSGYPNLHKEKGYTV